jgi:hypothetical protein
VWCVVCAACWREMFFRDVSMARFLAKEQLFSCLFLLFNSCTAAV